MVLTGDIWRPAQLDVRPGAIIGRYRVVETVGFGGSGVVLRAHDPRLDRAVALKIMRADGQAATTRSRMIREARAMARLSHPNVVEVYDVILDEPDTVVIAMEFVPGSTLGQWLDAPRPVREVLGAFDQAARGLAAAHAVGLLHRDFKPANVLVSTAGRVLVTDFGLAREGTESTDVMAPLEGDCRSSAPQTSDSLTATGAAWGTPRFMAPEQHAGRNLDARVDQFGFCVALWTALVKAPPYSGSADELARAKSLGPPSWPDHVDVPAHIAAAIRRGLCASPDDRWPSMDALRLALSPRRRRWSLAWGLGAAGVVGVTGLLAAAQPRAQTCAEAQAHVGEAWGEPQREQARRAVLGTQLPYAAAAWDRAAAQLDAYADQWAQLHRSTCEAAAAAELSPMAMDRRMACLQRARHQLAAAAAALGKADGRTVERMHGLLEGLGPLSRCAQAEMSSEVQPPRDEAQRRAVEDARALAARAGALRSAGRVAEAQEILTALEPEIRHVGYGPLTAEYAFQVAFLHRDEARFEQAARSLREAWDGGMRWGHWELAFASALELAFVVGYELKRTDEGLEQCDIAADLLPRAGADPLREAGVRRTRGSVLAAAGKYSLAAQEDRAALALIRGEMGDEDPGVALVRNNLASVLNQLDRPEQAEAEYRAVLATWEAAYGADHPRIGIVCTNLASALSVMGRSGEAAVELKRAIAVFEAALRPDHPLHAMARNNLATTLYVGGDYEAAASLYAEVVERLTAARHADHPDVAAARVNLGGALQAAGRLADARRELTASVAVYERALGPDDPRTATALRTLGDVLHDQGDDRSALPLLERAWRLQQNAEVRGFRRAEAAFSLAETLWRTNGDRRRAVALALEAQKLYEAAGPAHADALAAVRTWTAAHP